MVDLIIACIMIFGGWFLLFNELKNVIDDWK